MNWKKVTRVILPFVFILVLLFITYFGNQWIAEATGNVGEDYSYIFLKFNQMVPFLSWSIYPYILAYPAWALSMFVVGYYSQKNLYNILAVATVTFLICGIWWLLFQSDVESWRVTSGLFLDGNYLTPRTDLTFTESIVMKIYMSAGPRNALPSMHTLISWICIIGIRMDKKIPKIHVIWVWILNVAIILTTQTTKQHYVIDLIAAMVIAEVAYWVFRNSKLALWLEKIFTTWNKKLNIDFEDPIA